MNLIPSPVTTDKATIGWIKRRGSGRVGSPVGKSAGSITEGASQNTEKEGSFKGCTGDATASAPRNKVSILWWITVGERNAVRVAIKQPKPHAVFDIETSYGGPDMTVAMCVPRCILVGPAGHSSIKPSA